MAEVLGAVTTATKFFFEVTQQCWFRIWFRLMYVGEPDLHRQLVIQMLLQDHHLHPPHLLPHLHHQTVLWWTHSVWSERWRSEPGGSEQLLLDVLNIQHSSNIWRQLLQERTWWQHSLQLLLSVGGHILSHSGLPAHQSYETVHKLCQPKTRGVDSCDLKERGRRQIFTKFNQNRSIHISSSKPVWGRDPKNIIFRA